MSALEEIQTELGLKVVSIVTLEDVVAYLGRENAQQEILSDIQRYREKYGTAA